MGDKRSGGARVPAATHQKPTQGTWRWGRAAATHVKPKQPSQHAMAGPVQHEERLVSPGAACTAEGSNGDWGESRTHKKPPRPSIHRATQGISVLTRHSQTGPTWHRIHPKRAGYLGPEPCRVRSGHVPGSSRLHRAAAPTPVRHPSTRATQAARHRVPCVGCPASSATRPGPAPPARVCPSHEPTRPEPAPPSA